MHKLVRRLGDASARRPWVTILTWVVALGVVMTLAGSVGGDFVDDLVAPGSQSEEAMRLLDERFPEAAGGSALVVFATEAGQPLDVHRDVIVATTARVAAVDHVVGVADPFAAGTMSPDGRIGFATVTLDVASETLGPEPLADLIAALDPARSDQLTVELGGEAAFLNAETETSGAEAVGLVVALVVLVVAFGTLVAASVPIVLAVTAVTAGSAGIALLAAVTDVSTSATMVGAMIGLGVGIDYALFIVARYREHRANGLDNATALSAAMGSSGSAVLLAGGTVIVAMTALVLTGLGFLASIGLATSLVVLVAVASALTLLPAMLALLGDRIDAGRLLGRNRPAARQENTAWWHFAHRVAGRPWPYLIGATLLLLLMAAPALQMEIGFPDAGDDAPSTTHRRAYDLLGEGFGPGFNGPLLVVADLQRVDAASLPELSVRLSGVEGVAAVGASQLNPAGDTAIVPVIPTTGPADPETGATLTRVLDAIPDGTLVAGLTAMTTDLSAQLADTLPVFIIGILLASFVLLMVVFRSVAVPLKAAVMNLLSIGGAYGVVVAVFQWGWFGGLFGVEGSTVIASPMPTMFFAILFGLSMDYEVFLLSRIREEYDATGDNAESVARGLAGTGRVITSAALIMMAVFGSFIAFPSPLIKMVGLGLATAIVLDATVVRMVVVPAAMALMGRANWWLPGWLDRILPRVEVEAAAPVAARRAAADSRKVHA